MDRFVWDAHTMGTGVPEVDRQHQEMIRWINNLHKAIEAGRGEDDAESTLDYLMQYAEIHFAHEEACMTLYHCPAAEANRAGHERFREGFSRLQRQLQERGPSQALVIQLEAEIALWLQRHICNIDAQLARYAPPM